jgi:uncharacterized protein YbcI
VHEPLPGAPANAEAPPQVDRGAAVAEVSRAIVGIHSTHYGRGPTKSRTVWIDDVVVTTLEDIYTAVERTLIEADRFDQVRDMRLAFQHELEGEFVLAVERALGRSVRAFFSQVRMDPPVAVEVFLLEPEAD